MWLSWLLRRCRQRNELDPRRAGPWALVQDQQLHINKPVVAHRAQRCNLVLAACQQLSQFGALLRQVRRACQTARAARRVTPQFLLYRPDTSVNREPGNATPDRSSAWRSHRWPGGGILPWSKCDDRGEFGVPPAGINWSILEYWQLAAVYNFEIIAPKPYS